MARPIQFLIYIAFTSAAIAGQSELDWARKEAERQLKGCRVMSSTGVPLHTPDGIAHYEALWTRDLYYMYHYAGDLMDAGEIRDSILYILNGQRADGCIPDRVYADGTVVYSPGGINNALADHALDNAPFIALAACEYVNREGDLSFFREIEPLLKRGMDHVRRADNGLVYNPPEDPQCPYGFTDVVTKTGHLLFTSLLYYQASLELEALCQKAGQGDPIDYQRRARLIRKHIHRLWDDSSGMFLAADKDCRQIDIWGSAFAVVAGVTSEKQADLIADYLVRHYPGIFQKGQVRHLPAGEYWQRTFGNRPTEQYQNGAFWATPLPWIVPVLQRKVPALARQTVLDAIRDFQQFGTAECINSPDRKVPQFVVSATNLYAAARLAFP